MRSFFLTTCLLPLLTTALAQKPVSPADSSRLRAGVADSLRVSPRRAATLIDSLKPTFQPRGGPFKIIPRKATIRSLILPGLGQAYIKQYWPIPIIYAGFGALGYSIYWNQTRYKILLDAYARLIPERYGSPAIPADPTTNPPTPAVPAVAPNPAATVKFSIGGREYVLEETRVILNKNNYRRQRDLTYIGIGALWALNILQANVSAHLKTFDESDSISWRVTPGGGNQFTHAPLGATFTLNFSSKLAKQ